jgi:HK97 gp10 family phage protein
MTVRVRNMGTLQAKVKRMDKRIKRSVIVSLKKFVGPIKRDLKTLLSSVKSGPVVKRSRPSRRVKISNPFQAPAKDRGTLARSVRVEVDPIEFNLTFGADASTAAALEKGTRHMLPRPFLVPTMKKWRSSIILSIQETIKKGLK